MIVFEDKISALIDLLPLIDGFKTHFYWGKDGNDVNVFLNNVDQPYPFVFLTGGIETANQKLSEVSRSCRFILACQEPDQSKMNDVRLLNSYKNILNPLAERMIELFDVSSISRLTNGYKLQRIPNYSESGKNAQIDKWDVIVLECDLVINDNCLKPIVWD